jgi:hypothetical protein
VQNCQWQVPTESLLNRDHYLGSRERITAQLEKVIAKADGVHS